MRAAVCFEDRIVEVLDSDAEPRDSDFLERFELRLSQSAGLAFESDLARVFPAHVLVQTFDEIMELLLADVRRRAAAKINKPELAALERIRAAVELILFDQRIEIAFDLRGVFVGIDFVITKLAPLATEWNVQIKPERVFDTRRLVERLNGLRDVFRLPQGERRVIRDKVIADLGLGW